MSHSLLLDPADVTLSVHLSMFVHLLDSTRLVVVSCSTAIASILSALLDTYALNL